MANQNGKKSETANLPSPESYGGTSTTLLYPTKTTQSRSIGRPLAVLLLAVVLFGGLIATIVYYNSIPSPRDYQWWHKTTIYQIYPRSFKDSGTDGLGDLKGITSKLDHLVQIRVETIWLSPIYTSPMKDFGYDIADFKNVDAIFGTLNDFKELIAEVRKKKLRIVMDFVPNHSSDQHPWFVESSGPNWRTSEYRDYYIWHDGHPAKWTTLQGGTVIPAPPNNWISVFGGSSWKWHTGRRQYYLHQFLESQPDLNWRNEAVVEAMDDVLKFWLDLGVDGFRIDAIPFLFEVPHDQMVDADELTPNPAWEGLTPKDYEYFLHPYSRSVHPLHEQVKSWSKLVAEYKPKYDGETAGDPKFLILEVVDKNITEVNRYYPDDPFGTGAMPFYMGFVYMTNKTNGFDIDHMVRANLDALPRGAWPNWVIGNHDQRRATERLGNPDFIDGLNMLNLLLPGIPTTYYGEEIGMMDTVISNISQVQDPAALHPDYADTWRLKTRDYCRSPMQWFGNESHAGFTTAEKPWLPMAPHWETTLNVAYQRSRESGVTHYKVFRDLTRIRRTPTFLSGQVRSAVVSQDIYSFIRQSPEQTYLIILDLRRDPAGGEKLYDFTGAKVSGVGRVATASANLFPYHGETDGYKLASYGKDKPIPLDAVPLRPASAVVLRVTAD